MNSTGELDPGRTCTAIKSDGTPCQAHALTDEEFCFFHSPTHEETRAQGRLLAGRKPTLHKLPGMTEDVQTPADVLRVCNSLLASMMEQDSSAGTIASISRVLTLALTAMTGAQMEARVAELEQIAEEQNANRR